MVGDNSSGNTMMVGGFFTVLIACSPYGHLSGSVVGNPSVPPRGPGGSSPSHGAKPACMKDVIWGKLRSFLSLASDTVSATCVTFGECCSSGKGLDQLLFGG